MRKNKLMCLMSCMISVTLILGGCSKDKNVVFDSNVENDKNTSVSLSQKTVNIGYEEHEKFYPLYFDGNNIYGALGVSGHESMSREEYPVMGLYKRNQYTINENGKIIESDRRAYIYDRYPSDIGLAGEATIEQDIYYYNNRTGQRIKVGAVGSSNDTYNVVDGYSDYAYIMSNNNTYTESGKEGIQGENTLLRLELINLKDNKKYTYKGAKLNRLVNIVYSKLTDKFYVIDLTGKVYLAELEGEDIKLVEEISIDLSGVEYIETDGVSVNSNGEIILLNKHGELETLVISYNPRTKITKKINKDTNDRLGVLENLDDNKVLLDKLDANGKYELYIAEIKEDTINILTKVDIPVEENETFNYESIIMNDEGNKFLIEVQVGKENVDDGTFDNRYLYRLIEIN